MSKQPIHHWRWRSPHYLLTCGAKNGLISRHHEEPVTCKRCLKIGRARKWDVESRHIELVITPAQHAQLNKLSGVYRPEGMTQQQYASEVTRITGVKLNEHLKDEYGREVWFSVAGTNGPSVEADIVDQPST